MNNENDTTIPSIGGIQELLIENLQAFKEHPFKIYEDDRLATLADSIKEEGLLVPIIVRPIKDTNMYEILSGHNRVEASKKAELDTIRAEIRDVDDEEAIVIVNGTNIQQRTFKDWLESEKAASIAQYHDKIKRQGKRTDLQTDTSPEIQEKSDANEKTAKIYGVKVNIVEKYRNLNRLIEPLKERLDNKKDDFGGIKATYISSLSEQEQKVVESLLGKGYKITGDKAKKIRDLSKNKDKDGSKKFNSKNVEEILKEEKIIGYKPMKLKADILNMYFSNLQETDIEAKVEKSIELAQSTIPQLMEKYLSSDEPKQEDMQQFIEQLKKEFGGSNYND